MFYIGAVGLVLGVLLIWRANVHRQKVIAARETLAARGGATDIPEVWQHMGTGILPFYLLYGAFASLLLIGGFFLTRLGDLISLLDVAGLLVLIIGYTIWMVIRTYYTTLGLKAAD
jgi:hypothetical protein